MNTGLTNLLRTVHKDEEGLTVAELMMLAGVVIIPLIIVVIAFGANIIEWMGAEAETAVSDREGLKWDKK